MPNPFINSYRITKELEEKAREAKQKKEKLDSLIPVYEKRIEILKNYGIDVNDYLKKMVEIKNLYNEKSYLKAYDELENLMKAVDSIFNDIISRKVDNIKTQINRMKGIGFSSDLTKNIDEIRDPETIDKIEKSIRDEILSWVEKFIASLDENLKNVILRNYGEKIKSLNNLDLDSIVEFILDLNEERLKIINERINQENDKLSNLKEIALKLKLNTTDLKEKENIFYDLAKNGKLEDALKTLKEINNEYAKRIEKFINDAINVIKKEIENIKSFNIDVSKYIKTLDEIERAKSEGNYSNAIDVIKILLSEIENTKIKKIGEIIEKARDEIQKAKSEGFDVKILLGYIDEAKKNLVNRKFGDAIKNVSLVNETIEKMRKRRDEMINEIENIRKEFGDLVSTYDLDRIVALAKSDPNRAEMELKKLKDSIDRSIKEKVENIKIKMKEIIEFLELKGEDSSKIKFYMDYDNIKFLRTIEEVKASIEKSIVDWYNEKLNELNLMGVNTNSLKKYMDDILNNLREMKLDQMVQSLKTLDDEIMKKEKEIKEKKIDMLKNMVEKLSGLDEFSFLKKFYSNEGEIEKYAEKEIPWIITQYIDLYQRFPLELTKFFREKNLKNVSDRIDVTLNDTKNKLNELNYPDAINLVKELNKKSKNYYSKYLMISCGENYFLKHFPYDDTKKYFENISEQVSEGEMDLAFLNLNTIRENVERHILETSFSEFRELRERAFEMAKITGYENIKKFEIGEGNIGALEPVYLELMKAIKEMRIMVFLKLVDIKRKIDEFKIKVLEEDYSKAMESYRKGDIKKSFDTIKEIEKKIENIKGEYGELLKRIDEMKKSITYFENLRIDLPESKNIIDNINNLILQGRMDDANDYYRENYLKVKAEIYSKVGQFIDSVEKEVIAQKGKRDTLVAEGLVTSARRVLKLDNAVEATKYAFQALQEIESYSLLKSIVDSLVVKVKEIITNVGTVDQNLIRTFENIQRNILQKKYAQEIMDLNNIIEKYGELSDLLKSIKEKINQVKEKINVAVQFGIKVHEILALYQNARNAFQSGKNELALKYLDEAIYKLDNEIERMFVEIDEDLVYISKLSNFMGIEFNPENIKSSIVSRKVSDLKNINDELIRVEKTIYEKIKDKMDEIYSLGKKDNIPADLDFIYNLWNRKNYPAIIDSMKLIESRNLLNYYDSNSMFLSGILNDTMKIIDFHDYIYGEIETFYDLTKNFGTVDFKERMENEYNKIKEKVIENFNNWLKGIENEYSSIGYEKSLVNLYALLNNGEFYDLFNSILSEKLQIKRTRETIEKNKEMMNEINEKLKILENYNVNVSDEKEELKRILEENVLNVDLNSLKSLLEELNIKLSELDANIKINLSLTIGDENIPFKAKITNTGVPVKESLLKISGVVDDKIIEIGKIEREIEISENLKRREERGKLKLTLEYKTDFGDKREKSTEMDLITTIQHGFKKTKATGNERCYLCRGKIFKDLDMVICEKCGATYHYQCAQRAKKCLNCGNVFDFSESKVIEEELKL